jgi:hypothetical protein
MCKVVVSDLYIKNINISSEDGVLKGSAQAYTGNKKVPEAMINLTQKEIDDICNIVYKFVDEKNDNKEYQPPF